MLKRKLSKDRISKQNDSSETKKTKKEELTRKDRKLVKKDKKDRTGISSQLMNMYEKLRRKDLATIPKQKIINDILALTNGKESDIIYKHDCVRVLECCVKFGTAKQREDIYNIYNEHNVELLKSKYSKHLVKKLLKYGNKSQRNFVIKAVYGNVKRLVKQKEASSVLEYIYHQYADSSQRASLVEEFYGPKYSVFKAAIGRNLEDIFLKEPEQKLEILMHMKDTLVPLASRDAVKLTIVQKPLLEYLGFADESMKTEMAEVLRDQVVHILHTYEGSRIAMNCIWFGSKKERKLIVKSFKTYTAKICMEEYGHLALLAAFDVIDDTVFVKKTLLSEILSKIGEILKDQYGRKVIIYLLSARDKRFFTPKCITLLEQGDGNAFSKKDATTRQAELRNEILDPLFKYLASNICEIIKDKSKCQILLAAMEYSADSSSAVEVFNAITALACIAWSSQNEEDYIVFHPCAHWVIKRLIQQDKKREEKGETSIFCKILIGGIGEGFIGEWAQRNRGAFVVASLLETEFPEIVSYVKKELEARRTSLKSGQNKGLDIVLKLAGFPSETDQ